MNFPEKNLIVSQKQRAMARKYVGVREWPVRRFGIYFLDFFGTFCVKTKRTIEKTTNVLFIYVLVVSYIDTQYVIVQKGWTKHIVSRRKFGTSYRHLPLQYYEIVLWTNS